jgi:hypothetical protein
MSAVFSECERYRYALTRDVGDNPLVFIMLNPSTADEKDDDPTIRRCRGFAKDLGYDGLIVVNLYAYRATRPKDLWKINSDPVGDYNDDFIIRLCEGRDVCCAWGANAKIGRVAEVNNILSNLQGTRVFCLGLTKGGMPKHPLYIKATQELIRY